MEFLLNPFALFGVALLGMFSHFLKKKVKGESPTEILGYFKDNFKSTLIAVIATTVSFLAFYFEASDGAPTGLKDVITVFGLGYLNDSVFNKYEGK